jgi:hypothetical protein
MKIECLIVRVAARNGQDLAQFEADLEECRPPSEEWFPRRIFVD